MINQLMGQLGQFTQVRSGESELVQLGRLVLGGLGWLALIAGISTYFCLYLIWYLLVRGSK